MRLFGMFLFSFLFLMSISCSPERVDTKEIDRLISKTDSLMKSVTKYNIQFLDSIYTISGKELKNTISQGCINIKDSIFFYNLLNESTKRIKNIYQYSHKEILFTRDILVSLKEEIIETGELTPSMKDEINNEKEILKLLKTRTDSSIVLMNESIDEIYKFLGDTFILASHKN